MSLTKSLITLLISTALVVGLSACDVKVKSAEPAARVEPNSVGELVISTHASAQSNVIELNSAGIGTWTKTFYLEKFDPGHIRLAGEGWVSINCATENFKITREWQTLDMAGSVLAVHELKENAVMELISGLKYALVVKIENATGCESATYNFFISWATLDQISEKLGQEALQIGAPHVVSYRQGADKKRSVYREFTITENQASRLTFDYTTFTSSPRKCHNDRTLRMEWITNDSLGRQQSARWITPDDDFTSLAGHTHTLRIYLTDIEACDYATFSFRLTRM